jgi:hypothetical protein
MISGIHLENLMTSGNDDDNGSGSLNRAFGLNVPGLHPNGTTNRHWRIEDGQLSFDISGLHVPPGVQWRTFIAEAFADEVNEYCGWMDGREIAWIPEDCPWGFARNGDAVL